MGEPARRRRRSSVASPRRSLARSSDRPGATSPRRVVECQPPAAAAAQLPVARRFPMSTTHRVRAAFILAACLALNGASAAPGTAASSPPSSAPPIPAWVAKSNQNAQVLMAVIAKFQPEGAARLGMPGYDEAILDLS